MIGYVTLGTNDLERASAFYDALFAEVGAKRVMNLPKGIAWGVSMQQPIIGITAPFDGQPATAGNGTMIALIVDSPEAADRVHAKALELGAKDEGAVGPRGDTGFYGGYFRDLDGNKLNCFCMRKPG